MNTPPVRIGALLIILAASAAILWFQSDDPEPVAQETVAAPAGPRAQLPGRALPAFATQAVPVASLSQQVDALIATRDPAKAYAAYRLLANCISFNRDGDRLIFDQEDASHWNDDGTLPGFRSMTDAEKRHDAGFCGQMTERMRQSRIDYLDVAARAGIAGAVLEQVEQGPFGDRSALATRPDDPLVREWKARVQTQFFRLAEQDADAGTLSYLAVALMMGNNVLDADSALAYRYGAAFGMILADIQGPGGGMEKLYGPDGILTQQAASQLTPSERSAQLVEARRIADLARLHRQQQQTSR